MQLNSLRGQESNFVRDDTASHAVGWQRYRIDHSYGLHFGLTFREVVC